MRRILSAFWGNALSRHALAAIVGLSIGAWSNHADAQVNPVYRQIQSGPNAGDATQQQQITVPSGFGITLQSGSTLTCAAGASCTGGTASTVPVTGITGLGTGVLAPLQTAPGAAGGFALFSGALGTPTSITLTNGTGLPLTTGVTGQLANANLANPSTTVNGTTCTLGSPCTVTTATNITNLTTVLGADVAMSSTTVYANGPSVAQGSTGTWYVSGHLTIWCGAGGSTLNGKLWDGTTVIRSLQTQCGTASNGPVTMDLEGIIANPAGNLRFDALNISSTAGFIKFNASGNSKDSGISAIRLQ